MRRAAAPLLDSIDRRILVDSLGVPYPAFKRGLTPRPYAVWRDLLLGHAVVAGTVAALVVLQSRMPSAWLAGGLAGACVIGLGVAYIYLFFHEAAHFNLNRNRRLNDRLANLLIGSLVGEDIRAYRPIHFAHHRFLGTIRDTERTYFEPLDWRFIAESVTGLKVLKVLRYRARVAGAPAEGGSDRRPAKKRLLSPQLALGLALHCTIVGAALGYRQWALLIAWLGAMVVVFPFFVAVRQLLEHRDLRADPAVDYARQPHGSVTRMFGRGPLAIVVGGAGFNRHLLHHWEPQIPCACLPQLEAYLLRTPARAALEASRATYIGTFVRLFGSRARNLDLAQH